MENLPDAIRNNGGGYFNQGLYWDILTPGGTTSNSFKTKIIEDFGLEEAFMNQERGCVAQVPLIPSLSR